MLISPGFMISAWTKIIFAVYIYARKEIILPQMNTDWLPFPPNCLMYTGGDEDNLLIDFFFNLEIIPRSIHRKDAENAKRDIGITDMAN